MSDLDKIEPLIFQWEDDEPTTGFIAQDLNVIDLSSVSASITGPASTVTISSYSGYNGVAGHGASMGAISGSSISIVDPYSVLEERLAKLEKIIAEEEEIRKQCEAVNNAYNEYRLLLVLAKRNDGDKLTEE